MVREFPLRPLQSKADLDAAIAMTHKLIDNRNRNEGETESLMALGEMIHAYEAETNPLPEIAPLRALRFLDEENDLTPTQLPSKPDWTRGQGQAPRPSKLGVIGTGPGAGT